MYCMNPIQRAAKHGFRMRTFPPVAFPCGSCATSPRFLSAARLQMPSPTPSATSTKPTNIRDAPQIPIDASFSQALQLISETIQSAPRLSPDLPLLTEFLENALHHQCQLDSNHVTQTIASWYQANLLVLPENTTQAMTLLGKKDPFSALVALAQQTTGLVPSVSNLEYLLDTFLSLQRQMTLSGTILGKPVSTLMAALATFGLFESFFLAPTQRAYLSMMALIYESQKKDKWEVLDAFLAEIKGPLCSVESECLRIHFHVQKNQLDQALEVFQKAIVSVNSDNTCNQDFKYFSKSTLQSWLQEFQVRITESEDTSQRSKLNTLITQSREKQCWSSLLMAS